MKRYKINLKYKIKPKSKIGQINKEVIKILYEFSKSFSQIEI